MRVSIYSIQNTLFEGNAEKLIAKTPMGEITVLENHLPIISRVLGPHVTIGMSNGETRMIEFSTGVLEVRPFVSGSGLAKEAHLQDQSHVVILAD